MSTVLAIIGMAARFPGANDLDEYWTGLAAGVESVVSDGPGPARGELSDADAFDAPFFGFSPREARLLDPQHRVFLECAWHALENAGYAPGSESGSIGVYAGSSQTSYAEAIRAGQATLDAAEDFQLRLATSMDLLTGRVAYKLGLTGPAITVQTGCSTSLAAVHLAGQALLAGDCDLALAGGVTVHLMDDVGRYVDGGPFAPDGHCRAFDAAAQGTVGGNGVGVVVLKRLEDALRDGDHVRALVLGTAMNNDGADKIGFTAPSVSGQAAVVRTAHQLAGVEARTIGYVEAHGTGTALGDPIEVAGLTEGFRASTDACGFCLIGSVKTNIGHTDAAAGAAGLIKTVLSLERGQLPPSLNFVRPNPQIDFAASPFSVNTELRAWPAGDSPRRAGVHALGVGGTNVHIVLEQAPPAERGDPGRPWHLLPLSARTPVALDAVTTRLADHLRAHPLTPLADVAWTLQVGRAALERRRFAVCSDDAGDAARVLSGQEPSRLVTGPGTRHPPAPPVAFLYPGQGGQHPGMGAALYATEPVFRDAVAECAALASAQLELGQPIADRLDELPAAHVAIFTIEHALSALWRSWGVRPDAVAGHSLGAYAAACQSGILSLPDALWLVVERARLLETVPPGAMVAVGLTEEDLRERLDAGLSVAAVNAPAQCVVSGPAAAVTTFGEKLAADGIDVRPLRIPAAGHSDLVDPVVDAFAERVRSVELRPPAIPVVSDSTGTWLTPDEATDPGYWAAHVRRTVRFGAALTTLLDARDRVLLEVGPSQVLTNLVRRHPGVSSGHLALASLPHPADPTPEQQSMLTAAGRLWLADVPLAWSELHRGDRRHRVLLPPYPFARHRFAPFVEAAALESVERPSDVDSSETVPRTHAERMIAAAFADVLGLAGVGIDENFFELGGDSLIATRLVTKVRDVLGAQIQTRDIFRAPTVAALAALADTGAS